MAMRTDEHRPAEFDPSDYVVIDYLDNRRPEYQPGMPIEAFEAAVALWQRRIFQHFPDFRTGGTDHRSISTCNHCGHPGIRWVAVVKQISTGKKLAFGETCADRVELSGRDSFKAKFIKDRAALELAALMNAANRENFRRDHEDLVAFLDRQGERDAEWTRRYDEIMAEYQAKCAAADEQGIDYFDREYPRYPDYQVRRLDGVHPFIQDMIRTLERKGELSDGQIAATEKFMAREAEHEARRAQREADDAAHAPTGPLAEGRRVVEGEILMAEFRPGFGDDLTPKMLVRQDDGNKVWSTVPVAAFDDPANESEQNPTGIHHIDEFKGRRIQFTGTVERSRDDEHFGFAKRPTKAAVQWDDNGKEEAR